MFQQVSCNLDQFGWILKTAAIIFRKKLQFFSLNNINQQVPVELSQRLMTLHPQQKSTSTLAILTDKPLINIS